MAMATASRRAETVADRLSRRGSGRAGSRRRCRRCRRRSRDRRLDVLPPAQRTNRNRYVIQSSVRQIRAMNRRSWATVRFRVVLHALVSTELAAGIPSISTRASSLERRAWWAGAGRKGTPNSMNGAAATGQQPHPQSRSIAGAVPGSGCRSRDGDVVLPAEQGPAGFTDRVGAAGRCWYRGIHGEIAGLRHQLGASTVGQVQPAQPPLHWGPASSRSSPHRRRRPTAPRYREAFSAVLMWAFLSPASITG